MKQMLITGCLTLMLVVGFGFAGAAQVVSVGTAEVDVNETVEVPVTYDEASDGLAGFTLRVTLPNEGVATIESVELVAFSGASIVEISSDGFQASFQAADFGQGVEPGDSDVTLARITLRGLDDGVSSIALEILRFDADGGEDLVASTTAEAGEITVGEGGNGNGSDAPPRFVNQQPVDGSTITQNQPTISVDIIDALDGVSATSISLRISYAGTSSMFGRTDVGANWDGTTFAVDLAQTGVTLSQGAVSVDVSASDNAGNTDTASWTFTVSAAGAGEPSVALNSPRNGATLDSTDVTFEFTVDDEDDSEVDYELLVDGSVVASGTAQAGAPVSERVSLAEGDHTWQVRATDGDGNQASSAQRTLTVDTGGGNGGQSSIDCAIAQNSGDPSVIEDDDIMLAIRLWILGDTVPGTGGQTIDDARILELISTWILGTSLSC